MFQLVTKDPYHLTKTQLGEIEKIEHPYLAAIRQSLRHVPMYAQISRL